MRLAIKFVLILLTSLLIGCAGSNIDPRQITNSHIILDENTDPKFQIQQQQGQIAEVNRIGKNVFINGRLVKTKDEIANGERVWTKSKSMALIKFKPKSNNCDVYISEFKHGRLYGETNECNHQLKTKHSLTMAKSGNTEYHVKVTGSATTITVLKGLIQTGLLNGAQNTTVYEGSDVIISDSKIDGPSQLSPEQLRESIDWLNHYEEYLKNDPNTGLFGKIFIGVIVAIFSGILIDKAGDDDDKPDPPPQGPNDGGDTSQKPPQGQDEPDFEIE